MLSNSFEIFASGVGNEKLGAGNGKSRSVSASPNPVRKIGEFIRVTETSPLIDPSEVQITSSSIHFAQPVVSKYGIKLFFFLPLIYLKTYIQVSNHQ